MVTATTGDAESLHGLHGNRRMNRHILSHLCAHDMPKMLPGSAHYTYTSQMTHQVCESSEAPSKHTPPLPIVFMTHRRPPAYDHVADGRRSPPRPATAKCTTAQPHSKTPLYTYIYNKPF